MLVLVQRKKEVQRAELKEAHGWRNSLEVSHFQLHCKTNLSYLPLQGAKSIPVTFLWALAFSSFSRMQHPPRCFPREHWILFIQQNNLCSVQSSWTWQWDTGSTAGSITRYGWPQGATWHPTGEDSSNEHEQGSWLAPEEWSSLLGWCCSHALDLADRVVMALQLVCTEQQ